MEGSFLLLMFEERNLCDGCKEDMRKCFYDCDNDTSMAWRPAGEECGGGGCRYYKVICY